MTSSSWRANHYPLTIITEADVFYDLQEKWYLVNHITNNQQEIGMPAYRIGYASL